MIEVAPEEQRESEFLDAAETCHQDKPHIVHLVRSLEVGGLEKVVCELVNCRGFDCSEVICLTVEGSFSESLRKQGGRVHMLKSSGDSARSMIRPLAGLLRRIRPDLIHCHNMFAHLAGSCSAVLAGNIPSVLTKHGTYLPRGRTGPLLHRAMLRRSQVVAVSEEIQGIMERYAPFLGDSLRMIPNGIAIPGSTSAASRRDQRSKLGWEVDEFVFIAASRIVAGKRVDDMIHAFQKTLARHPRSRLCIVGDGPMLAELQKLAQELGVSDRVDFLGQRMDVLGLMAASDAFLISSENEGLPMSLLEAMSVGLPVIVTEVGEMPAVVDDGVSGYLVTPKSPSSLATAMCKVVSEPTVVRKVGVNAKSRIEKSFSVQQAVNRYEEVYQAAMSREPNSRVGIS